jgi:two-component sensor histidine kinase
MRRDMQMRNRVGVQVGRSETKHYFVTIEDDGNRIRHNSQPAPRRTFWFADHASARQTRRRRISRCDPRPGSGTRVTLTWAVEKESGLG